jgi:hypothetical protein
VVVLRDPTTSSLSFGRLTQHRSESAPREAVTEDLTHDPGEPRIVPNPLAL